jgi:isoquinoline 1-oxidoreductase alpha subunit
MPDNVITVNGVQQAANTDASMPLLWYLRDVLELTGAKYSCGLGLCGACTVHLDGSAVRACVTPVSAAMGKQVTTIEGLSDGRPAPGAGRPGSSTTCRSAATARPGRS